jgi:hypothetical protein
MAGSVAPIGNVGGIRHRGDEGAGIGLPVGPAIDVYSPPRNGTAYRTTSPRARCRTRASRRSGRVRPVQEPWQEQAAQAHAAHVDPEQDAERHRRRPDGELQELEPDDFVDEGGAAGPDEQQQERREPALGVPEAGRGPRGFFEVGHCLREYYHPRVCAYFAPDR